MTRFKILPQLLYIFTAGAIVSVPSYAFAQTQVRHSVVAPGGESSTGGLYLYDVVGQTVTGASSSTAIRHHSGYVPIVERYLRSTQTIVLVTAFEAEANRRGVQLTWAVESSDEVVGYNIYRADSEAMGFVNVAGGLIPAGRGGSYEDADVRPGTTYYYRLGAVDGDGEFFSRTLSVTTPVWRTELQQNRPNPFNPNTTISFYLAREGRVELEIYDTKGRLVRTLVDGLLGFGAYDVDWDGTSDRGERVSSGVYFYRLRAGKETHTKKMTLLK